jgi:hypothetical protein
VVAEQVERFLEDEDNGIWFALLCEQGTEAIKAQAWQVAESLREEQGPVRDVMLELAHELLPDSPAGAEDPRQVLFREFGIWASRQPQELQEHLEASLEDGFQDAWELGLSGFRSYLRLRCEAALKAA